MLGAREERFLSFAILLKNSPPAMALEVTLDKNTLSQTIRTWLE
jgi:hypothetical protein